MSKKKDEIECWICRRTLKELCKEPCMIQSGLKEYNADYDTYVVDGKPYYFCRICQELIYNTPMFADAVIDYQYSLAITKPHSQALHTSLNVTKKPKKRASLLPQKK